MNCLSESSNQHNGQSYKPAPIAKLFRSLSIGALLFMFASMALAAELVNLNKANAAAIQQNLVGIGPIKAEAIIAYRKKNGNFSSVDDLQNVKGIGPALIKKNKRYLSLRKGVVKGDDKKYAAAKKQAKAKTSSGSSNSSKSKSAKTSKSDKKKKASKSSKSDKVIAAKKKTKDSTKTSKASKVSKSSKSKSKPAKASKSKKSKAKSKSKKKKKKKAPQS